MLPTIKDLVLSVNKALSGLDWNSNWQKIINWLTDGKTDIKVKSIELSSNGGIVNNGSLTQNGNLTVNGNLETNDIKANGKIEGDGSGLYNLVTQGVQAFTPFCINDGYKDSVTGNGDLISATAVTEGGDTVKFDIAFKVDSGTPYGKIRATTAEGSTFLLEQLNGDELAANGTFYYFISQGQTAITRLANITIHRQPTQPPSTINDVWLDTSSENLVCKKCNDNGIYEKWDYVPLGKVVVANIGSASATATVETFDYNQNGYNVNLRTNIFGITPYAIKNLVSGTKDTVYQTKTPTLVIYGENDGEFNSGWEMYLKVSADNVNWVTVGYWKIGNGDPDSSPKYSTILEKGLYWKLETTKDSYTLEYAPLYPEEI